MRYDRREPARDRAELARYADRHPDSYAGSYVDREGRLRVGFTCESAIRLAELRELVREPVELFLTPPAWTLKHLREVQTRVMNDRAGLAADGIEVTVTSIRERDNIVEIGVGEFSDAVAAYLRERYGAAVEVIHEIISWA